LLAGTMPIEDSTKPGVIPLNKANLYTLDERGSRIILPKVFLNSSPLTISAIT